MERTKTESPDVNQCERELDDNWNERKHLIDEEFELRLKIQELLVQGDPSFAEVRQQERACKEALQRNDEEYEKLVAQWGAKVAASR